MHKRIDNNQNEIVEFFRQCGASVLIMSKLGKGAPDIALGFGGMTYFFELKDGSKPASARKLTNSEQKFHRIWKGHLAILESKEDAFKFIRTLTMGDHAW